MAINRIVIEKLFNIYNIQIDVSKRCNILVGTNGVGKSTILKILHAINQLDFISLTKYSFERILIQCDNEAHSTLTIEYNDLFPSADYIKKAINAANVGGYDEDSHEFCIEVYRCLIDELLKKELLFQFLSNCFHRLSQPYVISRIVDSKFESRFIDIINSNADPIFAQIMDECGGLNLHNKEDDLIFLPYIRRFKGSAIEKLNDSALEELVRSPSLYVDLVQSYRVNNQPVKHADVESHALDWLSQMEQKWGIWGGSIGPKYVGLTYPIYNIAPEKVCDCFRDIYNNVNDFEYLSEREMESRIWTLLIHKHDINAFVPFIENLFNDNVIEINRLINRYYFEFDFVKALNRRAVQAIAPIVGERISDDLTTEQKTLLTSFFKNIEVLKNIEHYFMPALTPALMKHLFAVDMGELWLIDKEVRDFDQRHLAFWEFYQQEVSSITAPENRSEKMKTFDLLIHQYFEIKNIDIYPSGIFLSNTVTERTPINKFELIKSKAGIVDLSVLSSGEKKILLMLALTVFFENITLILDEPELSLSLVWQEKLLPDLLRHTSVKSIIVATHSPYIASDESLSDYIVYLPTEEAYKHE